MFAPGLHYLPLGAWLHLGRGSAQQGAGPERAAGQDRAGRYMGGGGGGGGLVWFGFWRKEIFQIFIVVRFVASFNGIVHYLAMLILKEQAVNGHHNGVILHF